MGPNPIRENTVLYITEALQLGYDCEIDVWYVDGNLFLGHDAPEYKTSIEFLIKHQDYLWIHCKNSGALEYLVSIHNFNVFYHDHDHYTITSRGFVWGNINSNILNGMICVLPEKYSNVIDTNLLQTCGGVCSDYVQKYYHTFLV